MKGLQHLKVRLRLSFICLLVLAIFGMLSQSPTAYAVLPPRPTLPVEEHDDEFSLSAPRVAQIYLRVEPAGGQYSSVVQWQDGQGNWRDVDSWRGEVSNGTIMWWVEEKDFGKGPFRWTVYQAGVPIDHQVSIFTQREEVLLATTQPFYLPLDESHPLIIFAYITGS